MGAKRAIHRLIVNREVSKEVSVKYIKARTALNKILPIRVKDEKEFHRVIIRIVQFLESKTGITPSNGVAGSTLEQVLWAIWRAIPRICLSWRCICLIPLRSLPSRIRGCTRMKRFLPAATSSLNSRNVRAWSRVTCTGTTAGNCHRKN